MAPGKVSAVAGALLAFCGATAQAGELLADLNGDPVPGSSNPQCLMPVGQLILFCADDGIHGLELWTTDGTPGGTRMLKDIFPGPGSSQPQHFVAVGSRVFFVADDGTNGWEIWVTDGTPAGTHIVPMDPAARRLRDHNGWLVQAAAARSRVVCYLRHGLCKQLK